MGQMILIYRSILNFGDVLSGVLIQELSGCEVQSYKRSATIKKRVELMFKPSVSAIEDCLEQKDCSTTRGSVVGLGSIMSMGNKDSCYWGAGFLNYGDKFRGGCVHAVRGRLSNEKLKRDGFQECDVWGDPTLLLPLWINNKEDQIYKIGIIPHWTEVDYFVHKYGLEYKIIDVRTPDVERVIKEIRQCDHILSSSLKGLIVAHAYNIPALWIKKGYIGTDDFKFHDYFSSVAIPFYTGFSNIGDVLVTEESWKALFEEHINKSRINNSLRELQYQLMQVVPFKLKEKYEKIKKELE